MNLDFNLSDIDDPSLKKVIGDVLREGVPGTHEADFFGREEVFRLLVDAAKSADKYADKIAALKLLATEFRDILKQRDAKEYQDRANEIVVTFRECPPPLLIEASND